MSARFPRYGGYGGYGGYTNYGGYNNGFRRYSNNRNWMRTTGSAKIIDPRKYGDYTNKDEDVLASSVRMVTWIGRRIICFYHAGVFYFGRKAIKLLENQAQFILPQLEQVANNFNQQPADRYSFGIVPHIGDSEKMVCVGQEQASWLLFNFLASNVLPVTFDSSNELRMMDMFESQDNYAAFMDKFMAVFNSTSENPFNPLNTDAVITLIGELFELKLLTVEPWVKDYRRDYRSWMEPLETGRQMQPTAFGGFRPSPLASNQNQEDQ